jgi:hypothetical protein
VRIGIGLPAAIPGASASAVGTWAAAAEASGFGSVGDVAQVELLAGALDELRVCA